ncbi:MAG TPA: DUF5602 domain-containing protein [Gemmatimonadaceae bacterium]|nr:DUF5602 domain-containing protein [Gemmatimonadaceae bacterium]
MRPNLRALTGLPLTVAAVALALAGCDALTETAVADRHGTDAPGVHRQYGTPVAVGHGHARTYVVIDQRRGGAPIEVGVALDEAALEGLPAPMQMPMPADGDPHAHGNSHVYDLALPVHNPTPYRFVELDWNPGGHEPPGVYDVPHFDFHFYTVPPAVRNAIDPVALGQAAFLAASANLPPEAERPEHFMALAAPGQPIVAVPRMGTHWVDLRTPELQGMLGNPAGYRPFTTTFLHGSWDGAFIFDEPMVTRAFILGRKTATTPAQRDSVMPLPLPAQVRTPGYYPAAYHVTYDAQAKEYRIALTQLTRID